MSNEMPKVEDKTPCEECGKLVTVHPAGRAAHKRTHKEAVEPSAKAPEDKPVKADLGGLKDDEKAIMERALAAQDNFRKAPEVFLSEDSVDENMALVRLYAPHCLDKFDGEGKKARTAKGHAFFANSDKLVNWASRGYVPVRGESAGFVTNSGGDVLCVCDRELFEGRERQSQNESRKMVRQVEKDLGRDGEEGLDLDNRDLRGTSLKVEEETIQV